ncbi:MAG: Ig-like domain-containing protein [Anaerolineae bacterium]|nr:Ig-like domain-containing protein [Anaerolineae bacterium]
MNKKMQVNKALSILILLAMVLSACVQATPSPTAQQTPTAVPTKAATATPAPPTATPMPLPPPRLLERSPAPGEEQPVDAPIEITFDEPMDQASVEAAFTISPTIKGAFDWPDRRTVAFAPSQDLERGARYQVTIAATARNVEGLALEEPITFDFSTTGLLEVSQVQPASGADELDPDTLVTVVFNRPVVSLASISQQAALPSPLTFMPPVRGQGEWLNTSIYVFRPSEGLLPATDYQARIAAGLTDTTGSVLEDDFVWTFSTLRPAILSTWPEDTFKYMGPTDAISVTFNQPMDHTSVQAHFSLTSDGQAIPGAFRWQGGKTSTAAEAMIFTPDKPLPRSATFTAQIAAGAESGLGAASTIEDYVWNFTTVKEPGVVRTGPSDGSKDVSPYSSLYITFASPMERKGFLDHLAILPQPTAVYTYWESYDTEVRISYQPKPATTYSVILDGDTPDKYGATLGKPLSVRFTTGDLDPYAALNTSGSTGTYSTYTDTVIYATYRNVSRLDLGLYRLSPERFMLLNGFGEQSIDRYTFSQDDLIRSWSQPVKPPRNTGTLFRFELTDAEDQPLPSGLYFLQLTAPEVQKMPNGRPSRYIFIKSGVNLTYKQTNDEAMVWATDLATGQPLGGAVVGFYYNRQTTARTTGVTAADGTFLAKDLPNRGLWESSFAMAGQPGDDDFAIAYSGWDDGILPWDFGVESEWWDSRYQGYLYTDRPIYRPGQTVYFKGVLRADDDAHYSLPTEVKSVKVLVDDPQGKELYKKDLSPNDMGTFFDELTLDAEAALGYYYIWFENSALEINAGASFQVAEYRAPEYQVTVTTDRDAYMSGDTIAVTAEATYYFGGPVANAAVHWSVLSSSYSFSYQCPAGQPCPWYDWTDYDWTSYTGEQYGGYGGLLAEGDAQTDAQGRVTFKVPADIGDKRQSQIFTIEASVTDINGQQVSNRTAAIVHKGEFYIGVAPQGYLAQTGQRKQFDLLTVDRNGEPVGGVDLTVILLRRHWYSVRREAEDGQFYWDWTVEEIPVMTTTVTTGDNGKAVAALTPKQAGGYKVRAIGRDAQENEIRTATYFWVWGGGGFVSWQQESNNRITLVADKKEYEVGDTAEILIPSPYSGTVQALVTIERGHLVQAEVRELKSNSEVLRVPITADYVPDIFVSVVIVQGSEQAPDGLASFKMGLIKLPVAVAAKELTISLTPDKDMTKGEHYGPRQTATYDVLVTNNAGKPVEAELSLRLADLAVLALAREQGPSLVDTFWRSRGLGVRTSMALVVSMEPFNREVKAGLKGGGGGEEGGLVRSRFADTAFWDPTVRTGKDGKAQVTVELPDNLTTWRMQAKGITADTLVGQTNVDILSSLDLLVRAELPRFFVVGDEAQIGTIVHNNTRDKLTVNVNIAVTGLTLDGPASQTVDIAAGDKAEVTWPVTALTGGEVKVRMWASSGDLYDGREDTLPVYRYSTPEVVATAGRLSEAGLRQEIVQLPSNLDPSLGELTLQIDGSLTAATQDALTYLEHYPWECTEQTVSRFLPNVLTYQVLDEMGLARPELEQRLAQMVGVALQKLYAKQHYDGGWGWWVNDKSNPYITAYVLHGMLEAHRSAFVVDKKVMAKGATFLRDNLPSVAQVDTHWEANRLAYMLYVLAEYGTTFDSYLSGYLGIAIRLFDDKRHLLDRYGQAYLAVAFSLLEPDEPQRANTLLSDLTGAAVMSATGTHWEEAKPDYWNMNTDIRSTAIVLWAMSRLQPDSDLLPNAVRWLMAARQEGHWESTQDTAWSLLGLVQYMRASGEMEGDFSYAIYLNGESLVSGEVNKETIAESRKLQVAIARLLVDEANRLVIERQAVQAGQTGKGQLYYSSWLRYYLPADQVQALERGIVVARQYSPVGSPKKYVTSAQVGDVIQVKLTIVAPTDLYYVIVEDPLPAGCEGVDMSLKTTSVVGEAPELHNLSAEQQNRWMWDYGYGWWWFSNSEMRDEKVALFADYLPRGTYEYTYLMRASLPGEFQVIPTMAYQMYFPEVFGRSDGARFIVEP